MLNYPSNFDTSAFPAGKRISVARMAAICCMSAFFLIICMCGAIWWLTPKQSISPVLIYVNPNTGQWEMLGRDTKSQENTYYYLLQKSLAAIYTEKWFTISGNPEKNENMWASCNRDQICTKRVETVAASNNGCDIYCMSDDRTYKDFITKVVPLYKTRTSFGEQWSIDVNSLTVAPYGKITPTGGQWVVNAHIRAVPGPGFNVIAYIRIARNVVEYPQTMGYYIESFNAYNTQE